MCGGMAAYETAMAASSFQAFYDITMRHFSGYETFEEANSKING